MIEMKKKKKKKLQQVDETGYYTISTLGTLYTYLPQLDLFY